MRKIEIVAEAGISHQGDMDLATRMIRSAKNCGADVVKFQIYTPSVVLDPTHPTLAPWWPVIEATELDFQKVKMLKRICDEEGIEFLASVFEPEKVAWTEEIGMQRYKIAARSVYNLPLAEAINATGKPVLASLSAKYFRPGQETWIGYLCRERTRWLYCVSEYPTPLRLCEFTHNDTQGPTTFLRYDGFSDHTIGITAAIVAMSLGARIIEKHFTLDRTLPGPDHACSIELDALAWLCRFRDEIEEIYGD